MRINNNSMSEAHGHMAFYIHMPQEIPLTRILMTMVDGWIWSVFGFLGRG